MTVKELDDYITAHRYRLINAVLVYQNGEVVLERYYNKYTPESRNNLKSTWKSIISLTAGICIDKGYIQNLDEPIAKYLPVFGEGIHPYHKKITIRHLLTMSSGIYFQGGVHYHCPMMEQLRRSRDWIAHIADVDMKALPGSVWQYKEWDVILASAVITAATGKSAWEICEEYLYRQLEIKSGVWPSSNCGINYNVHKDEEQSDLSARDMAKIGLLMLSDGKWNGEQIVSEDYINENSKPSVANEGYGLFWWLKDKYFEAQGFGGQEIRVYPSENAVAVIQATPSSSGKFYFDVLDNVMMNL
jgi:CubicO group peptidase (beta-lactamase class C family)